MSSHDTLNTQENRLPSESNKPRLAENHDARRDDSSSQSTGDAVVTDRRYERGLEVYASQFQIPREEVASWFRRTRWRALRRGSDPLGSRRVGR